MRLLIVAITIALSATAFGAEDCEKGEVGTKACQDKMIRNLAEWNASNMMNCESKVQECHIVLNAVKADYEFRKSAQLWLTLTAIGLSAAVATAIDSDNRWQGALMGGLSGYIGARLLTF